MTAILSEDEIAALLSDPKPVTRKYRVVLSPRKRKDRPHELGRRLNVVSDNGRRFRVYVRVNPRLDNNFSLGLVWYPAKGAKRLLIRCNGWHDEHTNDIEQTVIPADTCHIHRITERYQQIDKAVHYAEATQEFSDLKTATDFFVSTFGLYLRDDDYHHELPLFDH